MMHLIGPRLKRFRQELKDPGQNKSWSHERVAQATGLKKLQVVNFEQGKGAADVFVVLLRFYHDRGFNIQWALQEKNDDLPLYLDPQQEKSTSRAFVADIVEQMQDFLRGDADKDVVK